MARRTGVQERPLEIEERRSGGGARPVRRGRGILPWLILPLILLAGLGAAWASGYLEYGVWWLTNETPPAVAVAQPPEVARGQVSLGVRVDPSQRAGMVDAQVDGRPLVPSDPLVVDTAALPDGEHEVVVVAEDRSWGKNRSTARMTVRSDNTPPQLTIEARPDRVAAGDTTLIRVRANEPTAIQAAFGGKPLEIQAGEGYGWALVGFPPDAQAAAVPLTVEGTDRPGNRSEQQLPVQVSAGDFPLDDVEASAALLPLLGPDVRADEDRRLAPTYAQVSQPRLWEGRFQVPVQGPIITEFGTRRSYNGGPVVAYHAGTDFVAPAGRPVLAPNRGKVVLIDDVRLRGKIAVLDHGLGVFTTYAHLSSVDVGVGQMLERGEAFAKVGSTGLSTGPHLHWELWVGGANVDPLQWTERDIP